jgi:hypothetical protein
MYSILNALYEFPFASKSKHVSSDAVFMKLDPSTLSTISVALYTITASEKLLIVIGG